MGEYSLALAASKDYDDGYKLLELPLELSDIVTKELEARCSNRPHLSIRGREDDEAVLCTLNKTYTMRAVVVSNSYYVLTPPKPNESGDAVLRGHVKQLLEITPSVARLDSLRGLLRQSEYDGDDDRDYLPQFFDEVKNILQASDDEFESGLKKRHILILKNELRPIETGYLNSILELLLNALVSISSPLDAAPITDLTESLQCDHEVAPEVTRQIMTWFGTITDFSKEEKWSVNISAIVRQIGIGLLSFHRSDPIDQDTFLKKWRSVVGDKFEDNVDLSELQGNFIATQTSAGTTLTYLPSSELPTRPADRFTDLFLVQTRWTAKDIHPFLADIAMDDKERDKLIMKFTRSVTDKDGISWLTSRVG